MFPLEAIGYGPFFAAQLELLNQPNLVAARVVADSRDHFPILGAQSPFAEPNGRLWRAIEEGRAPKPATGDWLAIADGDGIAMIHSVLDRQTCLQRRAAGSRAQVQVIAANVDVYFIVTAVGRDLNPRRLERYLCAVWDSGANAVVVLNKCDLVESLEPAISVLEGVTGTAPIVCTSAETGFGLGALHAHLGPGITAAVIGSSGVGKSSLLNRLRGEPQQKTFPVGPEGKGRHTTTRRELFMMPEGGVMIDTPGLREFGLAEAGPGLDAEFADVLEAASECRFGDCTHSNEPGCAVVLALAQGALPRERWESYAKLRAEADRLEANRDPRQVANSKKRWKGIHKSIKSFYQESPKRK